MLHAEAHPSHTGARARHLFMSLTLGDWGGGATVHVLLDSPFLPPAPLLNSSPDWPCCVICPQQASLQNPQVHLKPFVHPASSQEPLDPDC